MNKQWFSCRNHFSITNIYDTNYNVKSHIGVGLQFWREATMALSDTFRDLSKTDES